MATQLFLLSTLDLGISSDVDYPLSTSLGAGPVDEPGTSTVTGPTAGVQVYVPSVAPASWWYRVNAVTISGAITKNFWMQETNMSANVGAQVIIDRCDGSGTFVSTVQNSEKGTELVVGTSTVVNWATGTVTSTTFADGDYIRVRVYGNDVGTMATGYQFYLAFHGTTAAVRGDSYVTFTETITEYVAPVDRVPRSTPYPQLLAH